MGGEDERPVVVVVGAGFAGLQCVRALRSAKARVVLIDRHNHHVFQPLLYQVATAALSPSTISAPARRLFRQQPNCRVELGKVQDVDLEHNRIQVAGREHRFDYLVLACGMRNDYFGNDQWQPLAPGLKSNDEALEIRRRILLAFEAAEVETDARTRKAFLTFVVVGGGPTGVELAGAIAEIATQSIPKDYSGIDTRDADVILVEGQDRVLSAYHPDLSARAKRDLEGLGVEVVLGKIVSDIDETGVTIGSGQDARRVESRCVLWAAGLKAEAVTEDLDVPKDKAGRVKVQSDLSMPGHENVFVVGDLMTYTDPKSGKEVPGVAQGAIQSGRFVGKLIAAELEGSLRDAQRPFHYRDKGMMATIGRGRAVAEIGSLRFGGVLAWLLWTVVHIAFLVGFRNKLLAMLEWSWLYVFWTRGARIITGNCKKPGNKGRAQEA